MHAGVVCVSPSNLVRTLVHLKNFTLCLGPYTLSDLALFCAAVGQPSA